MSDVPPRPEAFPPAELQRRQRGRNVAMLWALLALAVLFFAITLVKLSHA